MMWAMGDAPLAGRRIAIDAGHGGIDSGAEYHAHVEKDINLVLAKCIGDKLASAGAEVVYTRMDDVDYYTRGKGGKRADLKRRIAII
ncbi:MAG: N-acetylmuramoyl-L-alanine amidase [Selenomonadales bacterium]|nr:N-acetylmuramoyl-L-alanine amidase [Selenomonadales bacterium]